MQPPRGATQDTAAPSPHRHDPADGEPTRLGVGGVPRYNGNTVTMKKTRIRARTRMKVRKITDDVDVP